MDKIDANDPETRSSDFVRENLLRLQALFPELLTEGPAGPSVNVDVLKALVGDQTVTDADEKYGLNWHGKRQARQLALTPSTGTLRPCPEDSLDWDATQNLMIEGDNLEVLKLLQKSYAGKVKLIYIDPPYNTGKDFVYPDNFQDNIQNYLALTGQVEGGRKISSNTEASGRFHTDWLNMMYPRLKLARNLLRDDGLIFVSIDAGELPNLRNLCNEIFGEENFVAVIVWEKRFTRSNNAKMFATLTENLICYRKSDRVESLKEPRNEKADSIYSNPDDDPRGVWTSVSYVNPATKSQRPNLVYPILNPITGEQVIHPTNAWKYEASVHREHVRDNRLYWGRDGNNTYPRLKKFLTEMEGGMVPVDFWGRESSGTTDEASKQLEDLLGAKVFDFPKPKTLIQRALRMATLEDDVILDFFAGSGTTGHAVMAQNAADGGTRRYILVQLPEPLDTTNKGQKTAADFCDELGKPRTIAELTKERLRRASRKLRDENPLFQGDLGFRVFKLDSSNIRAWEPNRENLDQTLLDHEQHLKADRTEGDVLYEVLLKLGLDLCVPIEQRTLAGKTVHSVGGGVLLACLADRIDRTEVEELGRGLAAWRKELSPAGDTTCLFRDDAFVDDVAKTNLAALLQQHGIARVRSL